MELVWKFLTLRLLLISLFIGLIACEKSVLATDASLVRETSVEKMNTSFSAADNESKYLKDVYSYLKSNQSEYGLSDPKSQLDLVKIVKENGFKHIYFQQVHKSIPVYGSNIIAHINNSEEIYLITGKTLYISESTRVEPIVSIKDAEVVAINHMEGEESWNHGASELIIYANESISNLAYMITLTSGLHRQFVIIDAIDGSVIKLIQGSPNNIL